MTSEHLRYSNKMLACRCGSLFDCWLLNREVEGNLTSDRTTSYNDELASTGLSYTLGNSSIRPHGSSYDQYEHWYLFSIPSVIIANGMSSAKALLRTDAGQLTALGSTFTLVESGAITLFGIGANIWDNRVGCSHAASNLDTKIGGAKGQTSAALQRKSR
ncbi:hypothetical protein L873DRAFT_1930257 [Choiromyces venosus 120613-1]|uniref:Uncharacterized protein n=1 Tax=Choiromyces venosus 120613-1 TaxID=1336337 RepID=A0A3N4JFA2_9PEZI|nr:hypothetical protein L873DRAFT_1930257 [Choiromyces venosus 120613-1]